MHELQVTKELIRMILEECQRSDITPEIVRVELGSLASYKKDPIVFYFEMMKKDERLISKTLLDINEVQAEVLCKECGKNTPVELPYMLFCAKCESMDVEVIKGKDILIKEIICRTDASYERTGKR